MGKCRALAALATGLLTFAGAAALMLGPAWAAAQELGSGAASPGPVTAPVSASPSSMLPVTGMSVDWTALRTGLISAIPGFAVLMAALIWRTRVRERRARAA